LHVLPLVGDQAGEDPEGKRRFPLQSITSFNVSTLDLEIGIRGGRKHSFFAERQQGSWQGDGVQSDRKRHKSRLSVLVPSQEDQENIQPLLQSSLGPVAAAAAAVKKERGYVLQGGAPKKGDAHGVDWSQIHTLAGDNLKDARPYFVSELSMGKGAHPEYMTFSLLLLCAIFDDVGCFY